MTHNVNSRTLNIASKMYVLICSLRNHSDRFCRFGNDVEGCNSTVGSSAGKLMGFGHRKNSGVDYSDPLVIG